MKAKDIIYKKFKKLTNQKFDDKSNIYEIGIDSLDLVEIVTEVEEEYNVTITDEQLSQFQSISDVVKAFEKLLK